MASFLNLHTYTSLAGYSADLLNFLKVEENFKLYSPPTSAQHLAPYFDGSIAVGYGIDLRVNSIATINKWLAAANLSLSQQDQKLLSGLPPTPSSFLLEQVLTQLQFKFPSEASASQVLKAALNDKAAELDALLNKYGIVIGDSREKIALLSLYYNTPGLIGVDLLTALQSGDRAEAWYQIRYRSNLHDGHTKRRFAEAAMFGLYDPGTTVSMAEATQIYDMYTQHATIMLAYDKNFDGYLTAATADLSVAGFGSLSAQSLSASLQLAADTLINEYAPGQNINPLNIQVAGADANVGGMIGSQLSTPLNYNGQPTDTSLLIGTIGNNTLTGGSGSDTLVGTGGNDTMIGGSGNEEFEYVVPLSGTSIDTITDSSGNGTVWVGGTELTGTTNSGANFTWTDANGDQYQFAPSAKQGVGTLTITGGLLGGAGDQIVIDNFDLNQAETGANGYLGIKLGHVPNMPCWGRFKTASGAIPRSNMPRQRSSRRAGSALRMSGNWQRNAFGLEAEKQREVH